MDEGKGRHRVVAIMAMSIFIPVYFFVFAEHLSPELSAVPRWRVDLVPGQAADSSSAALPSGAQSAGQPIAFLAGNRFGYFLADGTVLLLADAANGVAISDNACVVTETTSQDGILLQSLGKSRTVIHDIRPFFGAGRLFSASIDGTGVSAYDASGHFDWAYTFPCQLSAFAASDSMIVGGTVEGWLEGVNRDGTKAFEFAPGGSRLPVILGAAISPSGSWIAAMSGIDRQRLIVLGRGDSKYHVKSHKYLESDYREPVKLIVMSDERHVLYRRPDGIGVWAVDGKVDAVLPVMADDFDASIDTGLGVAYVVARQGTKTEMAVFRQPASLMGTIALPDSSEYVRFIGSSAYIGGRSWLARFDFVED
ncbi:MAG TPA: hypothetical protein VMX33_07910 [bacterium]|nr:hypothetical protein [bacterium]